MSIRRIGELPESYKCNHPEHNIPTMVVLPDGIYEHICPACGEKTKLVVTGPRIQLRCSMDAPVKGQE